MTFADRLRGIQSSQDSLLCVGLDTDLRHIPPHLNPSAQGVLDFNRAIIEAASPFVCAFKLNLAFYEVLGSRGWDTLKSTLAMIPKTVLTIGDGKRGDIGNTSDQYAAALFDELSFDAVTVNPFMGYDSVEPFLKRRERGVFLLTLTSNAGSRDFQRLKIGKTFLFERIAARAKHWNVSGNIGLVVGATHPFELKRIRRIVPEMPILIPGVGKQGGDLKSAVRYGCDRDGLGAIINASRGVIYASGGADFAEAARSQAAKLKAEIGRYKAEFVRRARRS